MSRDKTNDLLSLSKDGVAKQGRPKVQPSTLPGIEPGTFWLAVRDLTNCTKLAHTNKANVQKIEKNNFMAHLSREQTK